MWGVQVASSLTGEPVTASVAASVAATDATDAHLDDARKRDGDDDDGLSGALVPAR